MNIGKAWQCISQMQWQQLHDAVSNKREEWNSAAMHSETMRKTFLPNVRDKKAWEPHGPTSLKVCFACYGDQRLAEARQIHFGKISNLHNVTVA